MKLNFLLLIFAVAPLTVLASDINPDSIKINKRNWVYFEVNPKVWTKNFGVHFKNLLLRHTNPARTTLTGFAFFVK